MGSPHGNEMGKHWLGRITPSSKSSVSPFKVGLQASSQAVTLQFPYIIVPTFSFAFITFIVIIGSEVVSFPWTFSWSNLLDLSNTSELQARR